MPTTAPAIALLLSGPMVAASDSGMFPGSPAQESASAGAFASLIDAPAAAQGGAAAVADPAVTTPESGVTGAFNPRLALAVSAPAPARTPAAATPVSTAPALRDWIAGSGPEPVSGLDVATLVMPIPAGETPAVPAAAKPTAAPAQTETKTAMLVQEAAAVEGEAVVETEFALPAADASADTVMAPPAPAEPKPAAQSDSITPDAAVISMAAPMVVAPALPRMLGQQPSAPQTAADVPALEVLGDPELRPLAKADGTAHAIADDTSDEPDSSVASTPAGAKTTEASAAAPAQQTARSAVTAFADLLAAGLTDAAPASSTTTASTFALMPAEAVAPGAGVVSSANPVAAAHASAQLLRGQTVPSMEAARAVGLQISKAMQAGDTAFSIRLDPPELGRVDIKLDVASDGRVQALVAADSPQVLDLLRRESMILERALTDAGLRTDQGALQFSLRQNSDQASGEAGRQTAQHESDGGAGAGAASTSDVTHLPAYRWLPAGSSLQVFA